MSGAIGTIIPVLDSDYHFLVSLSRAIAKVIPAVGNLKHSTWRSFENEKKISDPRYFIDGDHIESFLDLSPPDMSKVVAHMVEDGWAVSGDPSTTIAAGAEGAGAAAQPLQAEDDGTAPRRRGEPLTVDEVIRRVELMAQLH